MPELDPFESRLARAVGAFADRANTAVNAAEVARVAAGPESATRGLRTGRGLSFAWVLLLVGLLVGLVVGGLVAGSWRLDVALVIAPSPTPVVSATNVALVPTGIDVLVSAPGSYTHLVADGEGIAWLREDTGAIVRFDPVTGSRRSWSVADDAAFAASAIIPARGGGVWLIGRRTLSWFDGEGFRDVIALPADIAAGSAGDLTTATEAPDGTLWTATWDGTVLHWDGSSWSRLVAPQADIEACAQPDASCHTSAIAVDTTGRVWVGWSAYPIPPNVAWVSRYDGSAWAVFDDGMTANRVESIAQQSDGSIWATTDEGLARLDGTSWVDATAELDADRCTSSLAVALDGAWWCAGPGSSEGAVAAWRFDGRTWVSGGEADGLPGTELATVVPTKDGTLVGITHDASAIHVLVDGRWEQHPSQGSGPTIDSDGWPVLAVSRDELWAIGQEGGVWHFSGGAWTKEAIDPAHPGNEVRDVALAPDGTAWAAGEDGVAYWRDGRWVVIDTEPANLVTVDRDGTAWVNRTGSACDLWTLRSNGTTWVPTPLPACPRNLPLRPGFLNGIAVDGRGALWVGVGGYGGAVARWAEGRWETIDASDGVPNNAGVEVLGISAAGDVWIGFRPPDHGANGYARFDGTEWKVADPPGGDLALAPDGTLWATTDRGPAHYDGQQWTFPYPPVSSLDRIMVAPDGTVFAHSANGGPASIWRFPAPAP